MRLTDLIPDYRGAENPPITGLSADSRTVKSGYLFAALPGVRFDGSAYIAEAVKNGAAAVIAPDGAGVPGGVPCILTANPRKTWSEAAARFYPRQPEHIVAVTGTNGKTSTVHFARQLWERAGHKAASIGTLGLQGAGLDKPGSLTTPGAVALHAELAGLADAGVRHVAMEASSHGLDQHRLDGVDICAAGFTNLTLDHLDYHGTMDAYREAKLRLFRDILRPDGIAVLNADSPDYKAFRDASGNRTVIDYGRIAEWLRITRLEPRPDGQDMSFEIKGQAHQASLKLVGPFMAMNALCALGLASAAYKDMHAIHSLADGLPELRSAAGRLQFVPGHPSGAVYVDYAHTPDALEHVLTALRGHAKGRLIVVAGCGGDRDRSKRPLMGRVASEKADLAIITDDNPRSEDPAAIRAAMLEGAGPDALEIGDRREAIRKAVVLMKEGDVLVIAGKGHEQGQIINGVTHPFDDVREAEAAIRELAA